MQRRRFFGFTLIELMTVIIIIGLLASILLPLFMRGRFKAEATACVSNEKNLANALEIYKNEETQQYPAQLTQLMVKGSFKVIPSCPSNSASYTTTYTVNNSMSLYTLACPGIHYKILKDYRQGYPQYSSGQLTEK